jgi:hypothetical protein
LTCPDVVVIELFPLGQFKTMARIEPFDVLQVLAHGFDPNGDKSSTSSAFWLDSVIGASTGDGVGIWVVTEE